LHVHITDFAVTECRLAAGSNRRNGLGFSRKFQASERDLSTIRAWNKVLQAVVTKVDISSGH